MILIIIKLKELIFTIISLLKLKCIKIKIKVKAFFKSLKTF